MFLKKKTQTLFIYVFSPMPPHVHIGFVVPPPGCGRSVTDFCIWGAHRARLNCPDDVSDMCERGVPGRAFKLSSTCYPDHGRYGDLPLQGKIPMEEPGIEPRTSWLVVRSSDHQDTRLVYSYMYSSGFSTVIICCFSVFCMRYFDKLWSHFLFHQRCAGRNSHPNVDIAIRHVID
jgi:hypothetical protein